MLGGFTGSAYTKKEEEVAKLLGKPVVFDVQAAEEACFTILGPNPLPFDVEEGYITHIMRQTVQGEDPDIVKVTMVKTCKEVSNSISQQRPVMAIDVQGLGVGEAVEAAAAGYAASAAKDGLRMPYLAEFYASVSVVVVTDHTMMLVPRRTRDHTTGEAHISTVNVVYSLAYIVAEGPHAGTPVVFQHNVTKREEGSSLLARKACLSDAELLEKIAATQPRGELRKGCLYLLPSLMHLPLASDVGHQLQRLVITVGGLQILLPPMSILKQRNKGRATTGKDIPRMPNLHLSRAPSPTSQNYGITLPILSALATHHEEEREQLGLLAEAGEGGGEEEGKEGGAKSRKRRLPRPTAVQRPRSMAVPSSRISALVAPTLPMAYVLSGSQAAATALPHQTAGTFRGGAGGYAAHAHLHGHSGVVAQGGGSHSKAAAAGGGGGSRPSPPRDPSTPHASGFLDVLATAVGQLDTMPPSSKRRAAPGPTSSGPPAAAAPAKQM